MIPEDRPAALVALVIAAGVAWLLIRLAESAVSAYRDRPVVTKDPYTGELRIPRSPNPGGRPRRHGRPRRTSEAPSRPLRRRTRAATAPRGTYAADDPLVAVGRRVEDACQRGTVGCSVDHRDGDSPCETW